MKRRHPELFEKAKDYENRPRERYDRVGQGRWWRYRLYMVTATLTIWSSARSHVNRRGVITSTSHQTWQNILLADDEDGDGCTIVTFET